MPFDMYDVTAVSRTTDDAKVLLNQLRDLTARRAAEDGAVQTDTTRTEEFKRERRAAQAAEFSMLAERAVKTSGALADADRLLAAAPAVGPTALAHRGRFTTDGGNEPAWGVYWVTALPRWPLSELEALATEAVATGRLALADAVRREAVCRLEAARANSAPNTSAAEAIARAVSTTVTAAAKPELLQAMAPLDELRHVKELAEREWRGLNAPIVPRMPGATAVSRGTDPLRRLQALRETEAAQR